MAVILPLQVRSALAGDVPFAAPSLISSAANGPRSIYVADINRDGHTDVVSASFNDDKIAWYSNTAGNGTVWSTTVITATADGARGVFVADMDRDGDPDVLSASANDNTIAWYANNGNGTVWTSRAITNTAVGAQSVFAADVNHDGKLDVLSASAGDNTVAWYDNTAGNGTAWTPRVITSAASGAQSVFAADVNHDGKLDVLAASAGEVAWYENTAGNGTAWTPHVIPNTASGAQSVFAADINRDGKMDVLTASAGNNTVAWHENTAGNGTAWTLHVVTNTALGAQSVFSVDVDGDGDPDVLSASATDKTIAWYENTAGDGTAWTPHVLTTAADGAASVLAADVNGDGNPDVLSAAATGNQIAWYPNQTIHRSAVFPVQSLIGSPASPRSVYAADINADGKLDALSASRDDNRVAWYNNTLGTGASWITTTVYSNSVSSHIVQTADINGDGKLDALSAAFVGNTVEWHRNITGDGSDWATTVITTTALGVVSANAADLDGDGDADVMSASMNDNKIAWYENTAGDGSAWVSHVITTAASGARSVFAADVDGDGDLDIAFTADYIWRVGWFENMDGRGTAWTLHVVYDNANGAYTVYTTDLDRDGDMDVLSASINDDKIAWYENTDRIGTTWVVHVITTGANFARGVYATDVDRDGDVDVLSASSLDNKIAWYENTNGTGTTWTVHIITTNAVDARSVFAGDVDGNGNPDVLSASLIDSKIAWYKNQGGQFALTTTTTAPAAILEGLTDDVLKIIATHNGRTGDTDMELATLALQFDNGAGTPLTSTQANALIENLFIYRDDGSGAFASGTDTLVTTVGTLSLTSGRQIVTFADNDPNVQIAYGTPGTYFAVVQLTASASSQTPNQFRVTHLTTGSTISMAQDRDQNIPLSLEYAPDVSSGIVTATFNNPPTILNIADRSTNEDTPTGAIPFTVGDVETPVAALTVSGSSSNLGLVPNGNIAFGGAGANRTVTLTPAAQQWGTATITVTVSDGVKTASDPFTLTVNAVNDGPVNSVPGVQGVNEDTALLFSSGNGNLLSISDVDAASNPVRVTLTATNGTITLATTSGLTFGPGDGVNDATMTFTGTVASLNTALDGLSFMSMASFTGTASLQITTNDLGNTGAGSPQSDADTITISVNNLNDPPVNGVPGPQSTNEDTALVFSSGNGNRISISDGDAGGGTMEVTLTATNGVLTLSTVSGLTFSAGDGQGDATLTFTGTLAAINAALNGLSFMPTASFTGTASLQITTNDLGNTGAGGAQSDDDTVAITVNVVNDAPTLSGLADQSTTQGTPVGPIAFTVGDVETPAGSLSLSASSSAPLLVPVANIVFGGAGADRTVTLTPAAGQTGTATITITVGDGLATARDSFVLTVGATAQVYLYLPLILR